MRPWATRRGRIIASVLLLAGAISIGLPLGRLNEQMRQRYEYGFPDLQKAESSTEASKIVARWNVTSAANEEIRQTMLLDLLFALFYAPLGALLAYRVSLRRKTPWVARLGRWTAIAALAGGAADLVENGIMLQMLGDPGAALSLFPVLHAFTLIKGLGLLVAWVYIVFAHLDW